MKWFIENRADLSIEHFVRGTGAWATGFWRSLRGAAGEACSATYSDENEFLVTSRHPVDFPDPTASGPTCSSIAVGRYRVEYCPRRIQQWGFSAAIRIGAAPLWFPINYLLIEALERYGHFYGDTSPSNLRPGRAADDAGSKYHANSRGRLASLFLPNGDGRRPVPW